MNKLKKSFYIGLIGLIFSTLAYSYSFCSPPLKDPEEEESIVPQTASALSPHPFFSKFNYVRRHQEIESNTDNPFLTPIKKEPLKTSSSDFSSTMSTISFSEVDEVEEEENRQASPSSNAPSLLLSNITPANRTSPKRPNEKEDSRHRQVVSGYLL